MGRYLYILLIVLCEISVKAQTVPGTLSSDAEVCIANNSGTLTLSGQTGNVVRWEYSQNGASLWTPIANTSTSYSYSNLTQTTYFRVVVQDPGFPSATSNVVTITVDQATNSGTASSANPGECNGNTVVLSLNGNTGNVVSWQLSANLGITWSNISSSNDSLVLHYANYTSTKMFRAVVKNGVCALATSNNVLVAAYAMSSAGTLSADAVVCEGNNSGTLSLGSSTGQVQRWESSPAGTSPWTSIANTNSTLNYTDVATDTYFRAVVKNGNCPEAVSNNVFIDVNSVSAGGFITGTNAVCSNNNNGVLDLNNNNGSIVQWQYSIDNGVNWNNTPINTSTYTFNNLAQTTWYRTEVQNGVCPSAYSQTFTLTVNPLPTVGFVFNTACEDASVSFTNNSSGANTYSWDFGDGAGSIITSPAHLFNSAGSYNVILSATSSAGCSNSSTQVVTVYPKPQVDFIMQDTICGGNIVLFTDNSSIALGSISTYTWHFGDTSPVDHNQNTSHQYFNSASYAVSLTAVSNQGCADSLTKNLYVSAKPTAAFYAANVCRNTSVSFSNNSTVSNGSLYFSWNFGDSQTSSLSNPSHLYTNAGTYNVALIATAGFGCSDTVVSTIVVNEQPALYINTTDVCLGKLSYFTDSMSPALSVNYNLSWNLGNSNSVSGDNPTYTYPSAGLYQVQATLTTDSGCVSTASLVTNVRALPQPAFSFNNVCSSDSLHITNNSTVNGGTLSYLWYFGNGDSSVVNNPSEMYATPGSYQIQLIATSNYGCVDSLTKPVQIYDAPVSNFTFNNPCDGFPVQFVNSSAVGAGTITSSNWDFGDNSNSTLVNPSKQYLAYGSYLVTLTSTSSNGCSSSVSDTVNVYEGPVANFTFVSQCAGVDVPFTNTTLLSSGTYNSVWNFDDTTGSSLNSPLHPYQYSGTKDVKLVVSSSNGCVDSISKLVTVYDTPNVQAGSDTTVSKGYPLQLNASGAAAYTWSPPDGLSNPMIANPVATPDQTTTYVVYANSGNGCSSSDTITITIDDDFLVVPYNILTPDNNGKNDTWIIKNIESYSDNKVTIMDEWGVEIYRKEAYTNEWEGKNMKGEILPDGTYYYVLTFGQSDKVYKGYITLLRNK